MYKTMVKTRKILGNKEALKLILPLAIWFVVLIATFIIGIKVTAIAFAFLIIVFLSIIPIAYHLRKSTHEFRGKESIINKEVVFNAINGELYVDNKKMRVTQNKSKTKIYVDDIATYKARFGAKTSSATFIGTIEKPYINDFIKFLDEQGIKIEK